MLTLLTRSFAAAFVATPLVAQTPLPPLQESPAASVSHTIGTTDVTIDYHRPGVKGRTIWGALVPYGEVWRTGANDATTIRFEDAAKIDGHDVPAGTYAFFAIPEKDHWTLILNKTAKQWGAYSYDEKQDLMRWSATPKSAEMTEWLTYAIEPSGADGATVHLRWEKLDVAFTVSVDVKAVMLSKIDRALGQAKSDDWQVRLQAARYYFDTDYKLDQALAWTDDSIKIQENYRNCELKARILHKQNRDAQALPFLEKAIDLAKSKKASQAYIDGLAKLAAEWKKT
jgi:hypothetical protein